MKNVLLTFTNSTSNQVFIDTHCVNYLTAIWKESKNYPINYLNDRDNADSH